MEALIIQLALVQAFKALEAYIFQAEKPGVKGSDKKQQVTDNIMNMITANTPLDKKQTKLAMDIIGNVIDLALLHYNKQPDFISITSKIVK